jgi:hypothetical protein
MQIAVGGCLAQKDQGAIVDRAPWVDVVFGTHNVGSLPVLLERARVEQEAQVELLEALEVFPSTLPTRRQSPYSAWVSISVGCNNTCTFCIVPSLRGKEKDRRPGEILREVVEWAWGENSRCRTLAEIASRLGRHARADEHGREALRLALTTGDRIKAVIAVAALASVAARAGDHERAGRLWGAVETEEGRSFLGWWTTYRHQYADAMACCAGTEFDQARAVGQRTPLDEIINEALARPVVVG